MLGHNSNSVLVATAMLLSGVVGQFTNWKENQVNTTICYWKQPRAALVQDTVYLDGGDIWWSPGFDTGDYGNPTSPGNPSGQILTYNFSRPFSPGTNTTEILLRDKITKAVGSGDANSFGPNFVDGALLSNDVQFYLYGGVLLNVGAQYKLPDANDVLSYRVFEQASDGEQMKDGSYNSIDLPENITRYIAYGASASAPSENKAWYFSGLNSPTHGPIYTNAFNDSTKAVDVSNQLITVDMQDPIRPAWTNTTIGKTKGRSNAELVWVPIGEEGILVVLGGVVYPEWAGDNGVSRDQEASEKDSPEFMQTIDIYDVKGGKWYRQKTSGGPDIGTRSRGCAVVASAPDHSSFNIYYYGGFDGIHTATSFHDDVWVLSLPTFTWTRLNQGQASHSRAGHKCFMPYPDQMMVFGGYRASSGNRFPCLEEPVVIFNLTSGQWMDSYDPTNHGTYSVPETVQAAIGTKTEPADGWSTTALGDIFKKEYDYGKIKTYYPYALESSPSPRPEITPKEDESKGKSGLPSWLAPVLGVVLGLVLVTVVVVGFCLWRRRKILKNRTSVTGTEDTAGMRIVAWVRGQQRHPMDGAKAQTVTTAEEIPASHEISSQPRSMAASPVPPTVYSGYSRYEMDDTQVMELDDTSPPAELHSTGFTRMGVNRRLSNNATPARSQSLSKPSSVSGDNDFNDAVSQTSGPISGHLDHNSNFVDSPTLANESQEPAEMNARVTSDVSMITNRASHLRNLSDATVSSEGTQAEPRAAPERMSQPGVQSIPELGEEQDKRPSDPARMDSGVLPEFEAPVSPPTADEANGDDYLTARPLVSPITKPVHPGDEDPLGRK